MRLSVLQRIATGLLLGLGALAADQATAFNFSPIEATIRPAGSGSIQTYSIENPGANPVAVQLRIDRREIAESGEEHLTDASDLFVIHPRQMIVRPGARQSIRVQWVGNAAIDAEAAFRLTAEELPINLSTEESEGGSLNLLVKYLAAVYVTPAAAQAQPSIRLDEEGGELVIEITNRGTMHVVVKPADYVVRHSGQPVRWTESQLKRLAAVNVLADSRRRIVLPGSAELLGGDLEVEWLRGSD